MFVDKQTLDDLNIFGRRGRGSICGIFSATRTRGGASLLEEMFRQPLASAQEIRERSEAIRHYMTDPQPYPYEGELLDAVEYYLANTDQRTQLSVEDNTFGQRVKGALGGDTHLESIQHGVQSVEKFLGLKPHKMSFAELAEADRKYRFRERESLLARLHEAYVLDIYMTAARVAKERGFGFAEIVGSEKSDDLVLEITEMYHPSVERAVPCSIKMDGERNVFFLTGANMAGKSTFMKTLAVTVFLAHCGFPVPAKAMRFSVLEGLFTTINLPDNLNAGYSHFYTEVLRVKRVAQQLQRTPRMLIIFDEMFRGTNVKDAYDATLAITQSIMRREDCFFVISTHITEAGEYLRSDQRRNEANARVQYWYMPTIMEGTVPRYTYQLTQGITEDRHGMVIIRNEGFLDLLDRSKDVNLGCREVSSRGGNAFADKQTLEDLNVLGEFKAGSIFALFNHVVTREGKRRLEKMLREPMHEVEAINRRTELLQFVQRQSLTFPISADDYEAIDQYGLMSVPDGMLARKAYMARQKVLHMTGVDKSYPLLKAGEEAMGRLQEKMKQMVSLMLKAGAPTSYELQLKQLEQLLAHSMLTSDEREALMDAVYDLDVMIAVTDTARKHGFGYAVAKEVETGGHYNALKVCGFRHPNLDLGVTNDLVLDSERNVLFLTGANMAGKSTLMKSFSLAIYMAHCGLPIAAREMEFMPLDGLYTSINVPDNIVMGYSHYYAEVLRVKHVAEEVASGKRLLVLFDELFKGTNVKDAHEATVACTQAFAQYHRCNFIISTHILEAADDLKATEMGKSFNFSFMPTVVDEKGRPHYPYKITPGITADRHGMVIIRQEGILEMLETDID